MTSRGDPRTGMLVRVSANAIHQPIAINIKHPGIACCLSDTKERTSNDILIHSIFAADLAALGHKKASEIPPFPP